MLRESPQNRASQFIPAGAAMQEQVLRHSRRLRNIGRLTHHQVEPFVLNRRIQTPESEIDIADPVNLRIQQRQRNRSWIYVCPNRLPHLARQQQGERP